VGLESARLCRQMVMAVTEPQPRVGHSRPDYIFRVCCRAARSNFRFALHTQPTQQGTARRPHTSAASFPQLAGCAAVAFVGTTSRPPKWIKPLVTRRRRAVAGCTRSSTTATACMPASVGLAAAVLDGTPRKNLISVVAILKPCYGRSKPGLALSEEWRCSHQRGQNAAFALPDFHDRSVCVCTQ
jgi:hypothetical protein